MNHNRLNHSKYCHSVNAGFGLTNFGLTRVDCIIIALICFLIISFQCLSEHRCPPFFVKASLNLPNIFFCLLHYSEVHWLGNYIRLWSLCNLNQGISLVEGLEFGPGFTWHHLEFSFQVSELDFQLILWISL